MRKAQATTLSQPIRLARPAPGCPVVRTWLEGEGRGKTHDRRKLFHRWAAAGDWRGGGARPSRGRGPSEAKPLRDPDSRDEGAAARHSHSRALQLNEPGANLGVRGPGHA